MRRDPLPNPLSLDDDAALWSLSNGYATGVDARDVETFLSVFLPDATLSCPPDWELRGTDELATVPVNSSSYDKSLHLNGNRRYWATETGAGGEVYCIAHLLERDRHGGVDFVMFIRYLDEYARDDEGAWRIRDRRLVLEWTEVTTANPESFRRQ
jgi:hypothetical protein